MKTRIFISLLIIVFIYSFALFTTKKPVSELDKRFIKISKNGTPLSAWQGPWSCLYDVKQKLLWEAKTDNESIHDGYWTYSWFDGETGIQNRGDCYFKKDRCDTLDLIIATNKEKLCGLSGWRLPNTQELENLIVENDRPGQAKIATDYFLQIKNGDYWSSQKNISFTRLKKRHMGASAVNFYEENSLSLPYHNAAFVILVNDNLPKLH